MQTSGYAAEDKRRTDNRFFDSTDSLSDYRQKTPAKGRIRNALPPVFFMALSLWIADGALYSVLFNCDTSIDWTMLALGALVFVASLILVRAKGASFATHVLLGAGLGIMLACACALHMSSNMQQIEHMQSQRIIFTLCEDPQSGDFGESGSAWARLQDGSTLKVRVNLPSDKKFACWDSFSARCRIKLPSSGAAEYYWSRGLIGYVTVHAIDHQDSNAVFESLSYARASGLSVYDDYANDGASLVRAIAFGDRSSLFAREFYGDVKTTGLAHIVAVSGSHLVVVASFFTLLLQMLRVPKRAAQIIEILFIYAYVVFTGAPVSAIRAAVMAVCAALSYFAGRRSSPLSALGICASVMIALDPTAALSVSFQLSSAATLGIILFATYFSEWAFALMLNHGRKLSQIIGMTLAANFFTLPVSVPLFGQLPLVSPLSNVLIAPVFALLCVGGGVLTLISVIFQPFAVISSGAAVSFSEAICEAISLCARIPYACVPATGTMPVMLITVGIAAILLYHFRPTPTFPRALCAMGCVGAMMAVFIFVVPASHGDELVMIDVGQGDSFLIRSGQHAILVDTGTNDADVLQGLARHGVNHLEAIVITHPDDDHCGSLSAIMRVVAVDKVCVASDLLACSCDNCARLRDQAPSQKFVGLQEGDALSFGVFSCTVIWPKKYRAEGGNEDSVVMDVQVDCNGDGTGEWSALLCGDAEASVLHQLEKQRLLHRVDVFKVGHHGSAASVDDELLSILKPKVSLVSVGAYNRYGHPADSSIEILESCGSHVMRSDMSGDVVCEFSSERIGLDTLR